jgi:hypothetical protein
MDFKTLLGKELGNKTDYDTQKGFHELIYTYGTFYIVTCMIFVFSW